MDKVSFFLFIWLLIIIGSVYSDPVEDKQALLEFVRDIPHSRALNWNESTKVCNTWTGVICNEDKTRIIALHLPGVGLNGRIPPNTISRLSELQILSLRSNGITGPFPFDFINLRNLSFLYLQFNKFSGLLPVNFSVWKNLTIVNLSYNEFNGSIPSSLSNLTDLTALNLANNSFSGEIPDLKLPNLQQLNLANNSLTGSVPSSLQRFPNSSFEGNNISLIPPMPRLPPPVSPPTLEPIPKMRRSGKLGQSALLGIIVGACVLGVVAFAFLLIVCCSKRKREIRLSGKAQKGLKDLLRASAEVLGKGTFRVAYKAVLEDATTVVVKRLKEVGVGKREFEQQMDLVGNIRHENLVELKAYYYSKDEKLMVYDYFSRGSVSALLHGKRNENGRIPLDWDTRLRIAVGAARGIVHIHTENSGKIVHGNIKSSNIFLNSQNYGCVSDLGLSTLMSPIAPSLSRAAGYRAPEVVDTRKASQPSDVYSFGMPDVMKMVEDIRRMDTATRMSSEARSESSTPPPPPVVETESTSIQN
ncbi:hypothetical protein IFM89_019684 [Coptis chinensis]|uniref:Protein kinase domain-containing protein n=1 Tax=Coptis chinensis TaxID=261450 RepID=A0A835HKP9_9MAGN|nr:hypothetical protein IFM89_019684 [Coptis chinensis]